MAPLISDTTIDYMNITWGTFVFLLSLFGIVTNVLNIAIFWKQGLTESIILGFFCLSISDIVITVTHVASSVLYVLHSLHLDTNLDFTSIQIVGVYWLKDFTYTFSCALTVLLSLERCMCVISPFKVKTVFTRERTGLWILVIFVSIFVMCVPLTGIFQLRYIKHPFRNGSELLSLWIIPEAENFVLYGHIFVVNIVIPAIAQVTVTISVSFLIKGLRRASRVRNNLTSRPQKHVERSSEDADDNTTPRRTADKDTDSQLGKSPPLSQKEARLVKSTVLIVAIMSVSNTVYLILTVLFESLPGLMVGEENENIMHLFFFFTTTLHGVSASVNCFAYYRTSTRYREIARTMLGLSSCD